MPETKIVAEVRNATPTAPQEALFDIIAHPTESKDVLAEPPEFVRQLAAASRTIDAHAPTPQRGLASGTALSFNASVR